MVAVHTRAAANVVSVTFESISDWPNLSGEAIRPFIFTKYIQLKTFLGILFIFKVLNKLSDKPYFWDFI